MIPKLGPISTTSLGENSLESIVDWFDQHKQSFYTLGLSYLSNQHQMVEVFYRSIMKVYKQLPRFKNETSFETWVTSIFFKICRELAEDRSLLDRVESGPRQDIFKAFDQLKVNEKEAMVLTYVKGISKEEVALLLQFSVERIKELLFSGIQSLKIEMGYSSTFNGCKEYQKDYIDYLERTLERPQKIDFEKHIYHCSDCQEDLATFQNVMLTMINLSDQMEDLYVPSGFMDNIKNRLAVKEKNRQQKNKKRIRKGLVILGVFALLISIDIFTGAFSNIYYTWTEEDKELRTYLQQDLGENLNLEAESNGVRIKIKSAIADDVQTLVFYEIEDTEEDNQYMMDFFDGVVVENQHEIMNVGGYQGYHPPDLTLDINIEEKNVYQGKISLLPITSEKGSVKLKITKLQKLIRDSSAPNGIGAVENMSYKSGEWSFDIPVTKMPSVDYALNEKIEVEGIPVRFDKLTIAPTATVLQYSINQEQTEKRLQDLNIEVLEVNNKAVKSDLYGRSFVDTYQVGDWFTIQRHFDPIFGEKLKEFNVRLESAQLTYDDRKTIELDAVQEYPQTFEYAGSTISIDKIEVGQPTKVVISDHEIENRPYETFHFQIMGDDANEIFSMEMSTEGVLIDKNGLEYKQNENHISYEEIEQPRYFITVQSIELHNNNPGEKVIPKRLEIYGYNAMKYLEDVVKISLE